jgi:hypothetical protein
MSTEFYLESHKERDNLEDMGVYLKILKWILRRQVLGVDWIHLA